jgi:hypothetical protein
LSATTVSLLRAAAEIVGGTKALAEKLGIGETLLSKYIADSPQLPDLLLLRAVDIILADRQSRLTPPAPPASQPRTNTGGASRDVLPDALDRPQNCGHARGSATGSGRS